MRLGGFSSVRKVPLCLGHRRSKLAWAPHWAASHQGGFSQQPPFVLLSQTAIVRETLALKTSDWFSGPQTWHSFPVASVLQGQQLIQQKAEFISLYIHWLPTESWMLSTCFLKKFHFTGIEVFCPLINGTVLSWATFLFSTFPKEKLISRWWLDIKSIIVFGFNHTHLSDPAELNLPVILHYCVGTTSATELWT